MTNPILTLRDFHLEVYGGRTYSIETLKKRIREGLIPGGYRDEGGRYVIDMARYNQARFQAIEAEEDPMVRQIAEGWG